jgi:hypothetical protein
VLLVPPQVQLPVKPLVPLKPQSKALQATPLLVQPVLHLVKRLVRQKLQWKVLLVMPLLAQQALHQAKPLVRLRPLLKAPLVTPPLVPQAPHRARPKLLSKVLLAMPLAVLQAKLRRLVRSKPAAGRSAKLIAHNMRNADVNRRRFSFGGSVRCRPS